MVIVLSCSRASAARGQHIPPVRSAGGIPAMPSDGLMPPTGNVPVMASGYNTAWKWLIDVWAYDLKFTPPIEMAHPRISRRARKSKPQIVSINVVYNELDESINQHPGINIAQQPSISYSDSTAILAMGIFFRGLLS